MLKTSKLALSSLIAASATLSALEATAYEAGDFFVRAGVANVSPNDDSAGVAIPVIGVPAVAGTKAEVSDDTQLGLTLNYMLTNAFGIELLASTPWSHDITADLSAAGFGKVDAGKTKQLPPTLSLVWYPMANASNSAFQPYLGLGINYTAFFEEEVDSDLEAAAPVVVEALAPGTLPGVTSVPMDLKLDDSMGLAAQIGFDFAIDDHWHVNASVRWIDIDTKATFKSALGTTITVEDVEIDPYVFQINAGYKF